MKLIPPDRLPRTKHKRKRPSPFPKRALISATLFALALVVGALATVWALRQSMAADAAANLRTEMPAPQRL